MPTIQPWPDQSIGHLSHTSKNHEPQNPREATPIPTTINSPFPSFISQQSSNLKRPTRSQHGQIKPTASHFESNRRSTIRTTCRYSTFPLELKQHPQASKHRKSPATAPTRRPNLRRSTQLHRTSVGIPLLSLRAIITRNRPSPLLCSGWISVKSPPRPVYRLTLPPTFIDLHGPRGFV